MNQTPPQNSRKPQVGIIALLSVCLLLSIVMASSTFSSGFAEKAHAVGLTPGVSPTPSTPCPCGGTPTPTRMPSIPTVSITSPTNGATYNGGTTILITASASVVGSTISKVDFYAASSFYTGTRLLDTSTSAPYSFSWTSAVGAADYTLTAVATDAAGETGTSAQVSITVTDATPTPTLIPSTPTPPSGSCTVNYQLESQWSGGFTVNMVITNTSSKTINGWMLSFTFPGDEAINQIWNGSSVQSGEQVVISNVSYNGTIAPKRMVDLGFNGSWTRDNASPTSFSLNGVSCTTS